ncbi:type IV pilus modification protein PilV [Pseudomonas sp. TMP25]|uniref:type IV pilus modification protein PilV n=1 Tax=Pseudomonas sp. TMP25 TaxID=3136561 RepID=UPI0031010837
MLITSTDRNRGFSLIEVLIALFVLAIGLLGMATLMMNSMQSSQGASQRSAATVAAYDLIERMRVNRNEAIKASSDYASDPATADSDCNPKEDAGCSAEKMVVYDLDTWWTSLQLAIPDAEVTIQQDPAGAGDDVYCIVIFWQEPGVEPTNVASPCGTLAATRAFYTMQVTL